MDVRLTVFGKALLLLVNLITLRLYNERLDLSLKSSEYPHHSIRIRLSLINCLAAAEKEKQPQESES